MKKTITRFAPSPTGSLHIGGVRTALFSWLYARQKSGSYILRIEDTDRQRSTHESAQQILEAINWLDIDYDDIVYQSKREQIYRDHVQQLLKAQKAYYCNCSAERIDKLRHSQMQAKEKPRYDGHCRNKELKYSPDAVIRLRTSLDGQTAYNDAVRGNITVENNELDDLVLVRSDGSPTYNLCCVIDDALMQVTLVLRGDDHINNTPRQLHIYAALGYKPPQFAHIPMILGEDRKRLSKRHGALSVLEYRDAGYLPDALLSYLARLGWSHGNQEVFTRAQLLALFSLKAINVAPASFGSEKIRWVNKQFLNSYDANGLADALSAYTSLPRQRIANLQELLPLYLERCNTLKELADAIAPLLADEITIDDTAAKKHLTHAREPLEKIAQSLATCDWQADALRQAIANCALQLEVKTGKVGMPVRVAVTGRSYSPDISHVLASLDKHVVLHRIAKALQHPQTS